MNLNEKIDGINTLKGRQDELKNLFYDADKEKRTDEKKKLDKEIKQIDKEIAKIEDRYKKEREGRTVNEEASNLLKSGKNIQSSLEEYNNLLKDENITDEQRAEVQSNIDKLNEDNAKLKAEIYEKAIEKSGLSYKDGEVYPTEEIKKHKETIANLENQKKELEAQRKKQEEIIEVKKNRMNEQFNIAIAKYQEMASSGKISQELLESRIANMNSAREKDLAMLDKSLEDIDKNIEATNKEIEDLKGKISELEEKEKIFDDYNNVYYELFGETLDSFYIANKDKYEERPEVNEEVSNVNEAKITENTNGTREVKENTSTNNVVSTPGENGTDVSKKAEEPEQEPEQEPEKAKIVITSKTAFYEIYKKLSKGTITDEELNALTDVLGDEANYDKYGITTGVVFNKARKILKSQGGKAFKNIENFLKNANTFSDDIKFDPSIEDDDVLSHEELNSWKDTQENLISDDVSFSVEKYIEKIEAYKEAGNELTSAQQKMYKDAMDIKAMLGSYRKALTVNEKVTQERGEKAQNSIFYGMFKNRIKDGSRKALPEESKAKDSGTIIVEKPFGIELDSMVNHESPAETEISAVDNSTRVKESGDEMVK